MEQLQDKVVGGAQNYTKKLQMLQRVSETMKLTSTAPM